MPPEPNPVRVPALYPAVFPISRIVVRTLFMVLGGWKAEGREHVPRSGGVLIASNHVSYADPPAIGLAMPRRCWFMGKDLIFRIPVVAPLSRLHLAFPVRVDAAMDRAAIRLTEQLLAAGEAVCIYPEGHVSRDGRLAPLQGGVALIALRAGVPIVPAAIIGAGKAIPPPYCIPRFARGGVRVRFGPVIDPKAAPPGLNRREQAEWLTEQMHAAIARLLPPDCQPKPAAEPIFEAESQQ